MYGDAPYLRGEERQFDASEQVGHVRRARREVVPHPEDEGVEDLLLAAHVDVIAGKHLRDVRRADVEELLLVDDLREVLLRRGEEMREGVRGRTEVGGEEEGRSPDDMRDAVKRREELLIRDHLHEVLLKREAASGRRGGGGKEGRSPEDTRDTVKMARRHELLKTRQSSQPAL